jgi:HPr kinase/phosphorylase
LSASDRLFLQATCVAVDGAGVLLRGPSGSGKSDLALRLIDAGAMLVADDGVELRLDGARLMAALPSTAPESVRGRLEVRGLGLLPVPSIAAAAVALALDMVTAGTIERLPEPQTIQWLGIDVPLLRLDPATVSAAAKVRLAVRTFTGSIIRPP